MARKNRPASKKKTVAWEDKKSLEMCFGSSNRASFYERNKALEDWRQKSKPSDKGGIPALGRGGYTRLNIPANQGGYTSSGTTFNRSIPPANIFPFTEFSSRDYAHDGQQQNTNLDTGLSTPPQTPMVIPFGSALLHASSPLSIAGAGDFAADDVAGGNYSYHDGFGSSVGFWSQHTGRIPGQSYTSGKVYKHPRRPTHFHRDGHTTTSPRPPVVWQNRDGGGCACVGGASSTQRTGPHTSANVGTGIRLGVSTSVAEVCREWRRELFVLHSTFGAQVSRILT